MRKLNTRKRYRIIGSDYSAQEPRLVTYMSNDPEMLKAYAENKDLYCVIGTGMFNNNYEDNLEFYAPSIEIIIDDKKVMTGDGSPAYELEFSDEDTVELKLFNYISIEEKGDVQAAYLEIGDKIANGPVIKNISKLKDKVVVSF